MYFLTFRVKDFLCYSLESLDPLLPSEESAESLENLGNSIPDNLKMKNIYSIWIRCADLLKLVE